MRRVAPSFVSQFCLQPAAQRALGHLGLGLLVRAFIILECRPYLHPAVFVVAMYDASATDLALGRERNRYPAVVEFRRGLWGIQVLCAMF